MKINRLLAVLCALALGLSLLPLGGLAEDAADISSLYKERDVDDTWSAADATVIDLNSLTEQTLTLSEGGDYVLSGTWAGQIIVETAEDVKVRLILNGVSIDSPSGPAIYEKLADKLIVTLAEGTENTLTAREAITDGEDTIGAALYAEDDLSINGKGSLTATGDATHGIQSKADLIIADGTLNVTALKDGIRGRNSVLVLGGTIRIVSQGDGIVSTRDDKEGKGWVVIAGGDLNIQTGSGAGSVTASSQYGGFSRGGWEQGGFYQGGWGRGGWGQDGWNTSNVTEDSGESQKGVKAATELTIAGGTVSLNCADDGLHAPDVSITGGSLTIATGDDGIHADNQVTIRGGKVDITQSYEGIEGTVVSIEGGTVSVQASDDGINASQKSESLTALIRITGGDITVAVGAGDTDCLDSNGSLEITGGTVRVTGNSTFDVNDSVSFTGGTVYENGRQVTTITGGTGFGWQQQGPGGFQQGGGYRRGGGRNWR